MDEPRGARRKARPLDRYGRLIGPGAGVLLGAATAFFLAAMPPRILLRLIDMTGLPAGVANGQGLLALGLAVAVGVATWALFLLLDRKPAPRAGRLTITQAAAPVLRRADAHPDAPACRPIFAGSDLGPPLDQADWRIMAGEGFAPLDTLELTEVVADPPAPPAATAPVIAPAVVEASDHVEEAIRSDDVRSAFAPDFVEPAEATLDVEEEPAASSDDTAKGTDPKTLMPPMTEEAKFVETAPAPTPRAAPSAPDAPSARPSASAPALVDSSSAKDAPPLAAGMARLETALARKGLALDGNAANVTPLRREIRPIDGSLRDAIAAIERRVTGQ